jgi:hypothetical protein
MTVNAAKIYDDGRESRRDDTKRGAASTCNLRSNGPKEFLENSRPMNLTVSTTHFWPWIVSSSSLGRCSPPSLHEADSMPAARCPAGTVCADVRLYVPARARARAYADHIYAANI